MCRIWILARDASAGEFITSALGTRYSCRVLSEKNLQSRPIAISEDRPHVIFVDLQHAGVLLSSLDELKSLNGTAVIGLLPENALPTLPPLVTVQFDDVVQLPADEKERRRHLQTLVKNVEHYQRLKAIRRKLRRQMGLSQIVACSPAMCEILLRLPGLAASPGTVLITGETGTGKELIARAIHYLSQRAGGPFVPVDCGALPEKLVENELFGHVRGAYTDAGHASSGLIAAAKSGTLFLDEIESLPLSTQAKFLRFLQEKEYRPLGSTRTVQADVRVLAATNVDLEHAVRQGDFRKDLYYRLNVLSVYVPPLRERKEEIPALAAYFAARHAGTQGTVMPVPEALVRSWMEYDWPGNVRELENRVQQWLADAACNPQVPVHDRTHPSTDEIRPWSEVRAEALALCEQTYLKKLLAIAQGNLSAAARLARIDRKNLRHLLKKHGLDAAQFRQ